MLVRLFGQNFRSLRDRFELSLVASDLKSDGEADRGVIEVPIEGASQPLRLLRTAAIFGANASGKSTVLMAARALRWLSIESSEFTRAGAEIPPFEPFRLDAKSEKKPIELGCDVIHKKRVLRYVVRFGRRAITHESLRELSAKSERTLIEREAGSVAGELITGSSVNQLYVQEMQPNVTVLAKLAQHGPHKGRESARPYFDAIDQATRDADYGLPATPELLAFEERSRQRFVDDVDYREWVMRHLIRPADLGIENVEARRERLNGSGAAQAKLSGQFAFLNEQLVVSFVHTGDRGKALPFATESMGTRKLFKMSDDWWSLAHESITLFADELGASLHPTLLKRAIEAVNESTGSSQLVFATHDPSLMEGLDGMPPPLRRDQVYFTKKDAHGATELYPLIEFRDDARAVHNLRKRYLTGYYGALPKPDKVSL